MIPLSARMFSKAMASTLNIQNQVSVSNVGSDLISSHNAYQSSSERSFGKQQRYRAVNFLTPISIWGRCGACGDESGFPNSTVITMKPDVGFPSSIVPSASGDPIAA